MVPERDVYEWFDPEEERAKAEYWRAAHLCAMRQHTHDLREQSERHHQATALLRHQVEQLTKMATERLSMEPLKIIISSEDLAKFKPMDQDK